jgi:hypothetical protein
MAKSSADERLAQLSGAPFQAGDRWHEEAVAFLHENAREDELVIYASFPHVLLHAVLVPKRMLNKKDAEDLLKWSGNGFSSWGVWTRFKPARLRIAPPLDDFGSKALAAGEQLVFCRRFDGHVKRQTYVQLLQKFEHVADIHYVP